jgi:hypothetical protein
MPKHLEHRHRDGADDLGTSLQDLDPARQDGTPSLLDPEILTLGRRIVDELGGDEASVLSRWAAFRIAELIHIVDNATDPDARLAATNSCTELVLRVWQERTNWPRGWPPPEASEILDALHERSRWQRAAVADEPAEYTWTSTLPAIIDSLDYERTLWTLAALAEQDPDALTSWLDQEGTALSTQERQTLSAIREAAKDAPSRLRALLFEESNPNAGRVAKGDAASRARTVLRALQQTTRSRIKIAQQVVTASKPRTAGKQQPQ